MRTIAPELQDLLDLPKCITHSTVDLSLPSGPEYHFSTAVFTAQGFNYTADLRSVEDIKSSLAGGIDRVSATVQNVDRAMVDLIAAESLVNSVGIVGRYYADPAGVLPSAWTELFRGQTAVLAVSELELSIEILNDLAAAGLVVANWTLGDACQNVFKHAGTCGYAGAETQCNKQRNSPGGCRGRANEHHFNGMEPPDNPVPAPEPVELSLNYFRSRTEWRNGYGIDEIDRYLTI
jgi:hypothetical protein